MCIKYVMDAGKEAFFRKPLVAISAVANFK
jgi:hypothetical protein